MSMINGQVKWYKGDYGFIQPDDGQKDDFVHVTALKEANIFDLKEGDRVQYQRVKGRRGKLEARNLRLVNG